MRPGLARADELEQKGELGEAAKVTAETLERGMIVYTDARARAATQVAKPAMGDRRPLTPLNTTRLPLSGSRKPSPALAPCRQDRTEIFTPPPPPQNSSEVALSPQHVDSIAVTGAASAYWQGRHFTCYRLEAHTTSHGVQQRLRRYSDFRKLDARLTCALGASPTRLPCLNTRLLPPLPGRTAPWQDPMSPSVVEARQAALQQYIDGARAVIALTHERG